MSVTVKHKIPIVARGEIVSDYSVTHAGRRGGISFETPDPKKYVDKFLLNKPSALKDQYTLTFQEILDYLEELGDRVKFKHNEYLQQAFEISRSVSGLPDSVLRWAYEHLHAIFRREVVREIADNCIGIRESAQYRCSHCHAKCRNPWRRTDKNPIKRPHDRGGYCANND